MKAGPSRAQEVEKSLQNDRLYWGLRARVSSPVFALVDPWWTLREAAAGRALGLSAPRRS
jgi:hypothetical protein